MQRLPRRPRALLASSLLELRATAPAPPRASCSRVVYSYKPYCSSRAPRHVRTVISNHLPLREELSEEGAMSGPGLGTANRRPGRARTPHPRRNFEGAFNRKARDHDLGLRLACVLLKSPECVHHACQSVSEKGAGSGVSVLATSRERDANAASCSASALWSGNCGTPNP